MNKIEVMVAVGYDHRWLILAKPERNDDNKELLTALASHEEGGDLGTDLPVGIYRADFIGEQYASGSLSDGDTYFNNFRSFDMKVIDHEVKPDSNWKSCKYQP